VSTLITLNHKNH